MNFLRYMKMNYEIDNFQRGKYPNTKALYRKNIKNRAKKKYWKDYFKE